ncbi:hypothetical protein [Arsenicicoccus dermatophilus]|uniref:hypothetical protein n=1 Tax=Arsenicicoccus dermatophilus TaxID=1076331 RepID=UPI003917487E
MTTGADPRPGPARTELERVARRWQQLPVDRALGSSGAVRALAQALADQTADLAGRPRQELPDLGPATALHQLQVCTWDAAAVGLPDLAQRLGQLRRQIG